MMWISYAVLVRLKAVRWRQRNTAARGWDTFADENINIDDQSVFAGKIAEPEPKLEETRKHRLLQRTCPRFRFGEVPAARPNSWTRLPMVSLGNTL